MLCGDWNSDPTQGQFSIDETSRRFVDSGFVWTFRGMGRRDCVTWLSNGRFPDAVFDGFFCLPSEAAKISRSKVFETTRSVSDHISKGNGKLRPLGLSTLEDKIVQHAASRILEKGTG